MKNNMSIEEAQILKTAITNSKTKNMIGNRLKVTCGTRKEALTLGSWKGIPETQTYSQKPLPDRILEKESE